MYAVFVISFTMQHKFQKTISYFNFMTKLSWKRYKSFSLLKQVQVWDMNILQIEIYLVAI